MQKEHYLKRELNELIKSDETIFEFIQESLIDGLWVWDLENPEEKWTGPEFWKLLGYDPAEMPHKFSALQEVINPEDLKHAREKIARHCEDGGPPLDQIIRFTHKDGSTVWHQCRASLIRDESGKPVRVLGAHQDVTAFKTNEEHLRILGSIAKSPNTMVLLTDPRRKLIWANEAFWKITGYSEKEMLGENPGEILQGPYPDRELKRRMRAALDAAEPFQCEILNYAKDGSTYWIDVSFQPVFDSDGRLTHFVAIQHDITERKKAERSLSHYNQQFELAAAQSAEMAILADAASHAKSEFLANMSHEVRTPMNGVIGMVSLLLESDLTPLQRYQAEIINESAGSLLQMMDNVLEVANLESSRLKLKLESFDLRPFIHSCMAAMEIPAEEKGLKLNCVIAESVPEQVSSYPGRLRQILNNLLGNAIKFTESGHVTLQVEAGSDAGLHESAEDGPIDLTFGVSDTGVGIDDDQLPELFQPFTQADTSTTRKYGGSGLGLAICRQSVELMGGTIDAESAPGQGSTFYFTIPVTLADSASDEVSEESPEQRDPTVDGGCYDACILLAEDLSMNQVVVKELLEKLGHRVDIVKTGDEAVYAFSRMHYDLIFMDLQMPKMDGYEAARAIREIERNKAAPEKEPTPIIALTAHALDRDRDACTAVGMNDFLAKPIHLGTLEKALRKWLAPKSTSEKPPSSGEYRPTTETPKKNPEERETAQLPSAMETPTCRMLQSLQETSKDEFKTLENAITRTDEGEATRSLDRLRVMSAFLRLHSLETLGSQLEQAIDYGQWDAANLLFGRFQETHAEMIDKMKRDETNALSIARKGIV